jgi:hypothetical protein
MRRPDWVPEPAWGRLDAALRAQPEHATATLDDLGVLGARWDAAARARLLERFCLRAERGAPLPAAFICALSDLLEGDG